MVMVGGYDLIIVAAVIVILIILLVSKRRKSKNKNSTAVNDSYKGPRIVIGYERSGGLLEDGKCGWLDVEREDGENRTFKLDFNKKTPAPIIVPLEKSVYRITYRTQSKAAMIASGALRTINEGNGVMGSFANAVYDAGGMNGQLDSIVVEVDDEFVLRLSCTTDGLTKSCNII